MSSKSTDLYISTRRILRAILAPHHMSQMLRILSSERFCHARIIDKLGPKKNTALSC